MADGTLMSSVAAWFVTPEEPPPKSFVEDVGLPALLLGSAVLVYIAVHLYREHRRLPSIRIGLFETLRNYKPGVHLEYYHATWVNRSFRKTFTIGLPHDPRIFGTCDPAIVEHVLITKGPAFYEKGPQWRTAFHDLLGGGIFNADGDHWKLQRKLAAHEFSVRSLRDFMTTTFRAHVGKLCEIVDAHAGAPFDVQQLFARYTLDSIGQIGFGVEIGCLDDKEGQDEERKAFAAAFDTSTNLIGNRFVDPLWKVKRLLARTPLARGYEAELRKAIEVVNAWSKKIIAERRSSSDVASRTDILSRFMTTTGGDDTALRDVVINFILAGRDTTAILLTWTMYELSSKPHVVAKLRAEAARAKREGERLEADGGFGFSALTRMPYLKATLTEVLRLHPSVPLDFKAATADDALPDGTRLKKGERVMFVAWSMGRDAKIWERPDEFDPLRFIDAEGNFRFPPMASFPVFLAGPRTCLGKDMAYLGAGLLLTALLERYDIELACDPKERVNTEWHGHATHARGVTYGLGLTLWVHGGLPVRLARRAATHPRFVKGATVADAYPVGAAADDDDGEEVTLGEAKTIQLSAKDFVKKGA